MTERLYYINPELREFEARVVRAEVRDGRNVALLDRTAFYPSSGGQPFDTGTLGSSRVVDVLDDEEEVVHVVDAPIAVGDSVRGVIDWDRRFDHMQQHTGQHVLSAAFDKLLSARTESFHLGTATSTIDLSSVLNAEQITRAETEANRIVWENRQVNIRFVDASDPIAQRLRKESSRTGMLRLIDIDEFDLSACGGTHVERTGAIGIIAVASSEKFRGGTRVEFVCGGRVLREYRTLRDTSSASIKLLSVHPSELPAAVSRLQEDLKAANRSIRDFQIRLAGHEADRMVTAADGVVIVQVVDGWDQQGLKAIASSIVRRSGHAAVLIGAPTPCPVVVARAPDVQIDAAAVLRALVDRFGGKGGGRPELAQGGGLQGDPAEIASAARELLQG